MSEISSLNLAQAVTLLKTTPETLRRLLSPLDSHLGCWRPAPDQWCINEVVGHFIESDEHSFAAPIQSILVQEWPELESWDVHAVAAGRRDYERDLSELLAEFETTRLANVGLVSELRPSQLARAGFHPEVGEIQVVDYIYEWVYHDCNHIKQVLNAIQLAVWPKMGNIRHFAPPK